MSSRRHIRTLRRLQRKLWDSIRKMEDRLECRSCSVPRELRQAIGSLSIYCGKRIDAADRFIRRYRKQFATRFFHWILLGLPGFNLFTEFHTQLVDCQQWADVIIQTMAILLLSAEARAISINRDLHPQNVPRGAEEVKCWVHLPESFTYCKVEEGWAKIECREDLKEALEVTQIQHPRRIRNRNDLVSNGVDLDGLELLVGRILYNGSIPSSTESISYTRSPPPIESRPNQHRRRYRTTRAVSPNQRPEANNALTASITYTRPIGQRDDLSTRIQVPKRDAHQPSTTIPDDQRSRRPRSVQPTNIHPKDLLSNTFQHGPAETIALNIPLLNTGPNIRRNDLPPDVRPPNTRLEVRPTDTHNTRRVDIHPAVGPRTVLQDKLERVYPFHQPYQPTPAAKHWVANGEPRIVDLFVRKDEESSRREDCDVIPDVTRQGQTKPRSQRQDKYTRTEEIQSQLVHPQQESHVTVEKSSSQRPEPVLRRSRRRSPNYNSENEQLQHGVPLTRVPLSAKISPSDVPHMYQKHQVGGDIRPLPLAQRRIINLADRRDFTERPTLNTMEKIPQHDRTQKNVRQKEEHVRPQGRPKVETHSGIGVDLPRDQTRNRTAIDNSIAPVLKPEQLPRSRQSRSKHREPSVNHTHKTNAAHFNGSMDCDTSSFPDTPLPHRVSLSKDDRRRLESLEIKQPVPRRNSLQFRGDLRNYATPITDHNANNHRNMADNANMERKPDKFLQKRPPGSSHISSEKTQMSRTSSRAPSSSGYDPGIGMSRTESQTSNPVFESSTDSAARRGSTKQMPLAYKFDEGRRGRRDVSASSYDSGIGMSSDAESQR
ncbi:uncharacterized protein LY89DRAFT_664605 [Mollisia scopiformis]|uniref:Uncharacterized protein n=1 Tax=Mollisia scopiformis TaxID=149040 RepID=A0A194XRZ2_MOLSC|nr:uncharacterized protein LY89DRAFT_664605 [Mollisia scopiformis]KUJ22819.1 hypothetical protein LY89DRAFT_664605 [Mollisia scopiformis]